MTRFPTPDAGLYLTLMCSQRAQQQERWCLVTHPVMNYSQFCLKGTPTLSTACDHTLICIESLKVHLC